MSAKTVRHTGKLADFTLRFTSFRFHEQTF
jgi:hypothetical protein